jgi:hypothetical protein
MNGCWNCNNFKRIIENGIFKKYMCLYDNHTWENEEGLEEICEMWE